MTIYVISPPADDWGDDYITDVTTSEASVAFWRTAGRGFTYNIEEQPDADEAELAIVETLNDWLIANYDRGAHWVYETTDKLTHVVMLRKLGGDLEAYKADLSKHWELVDEYASDIRKS